MPTLVPTGATFGNQLKDFFSKNALSAELWIVAPSFALTELQALGESRFFQERLTHAATLDAIRLITFDESGTWAEVNPETTRDALKVEDHAESVRAQGLRVMFRDSGGLSQAHAGLHYVKPGGSHTRQFLRAGSVVARSPLAFFVASALLPWASTRPHERIWVDTSAIATVGHALSALQAMFKQKPRLTAVDSFGGYERLKLHAIDPAENPLVLISASTSGKLAAAVSTTHGITESDILTLFYVGPDSPSQALCDLTLRDPRDADADADGDRIPVIESWGSDCPLCQDGLTALRLEGEDFIPEATQASERMLTGQHSSKNLRSLMRQFQGANLISVGRSSDTHLGRSRTVSFDLEAAVRDEESIIRKRIVRDLKRQLPARTRWIVTPGDPDSNLVADLALEVCRETGLGGVEIVGTAELDRGRELGAGHVFVVAGTVGSGRALLNVSRQLRSAHNDLIHYFIVCAKPRSTRAWTTLTGDLQYGEVPKEYPLHNIWLVETEPDRGESGPWVVERTTLQTVAIELEASGDIPDEVSAPIRSRLEALDGDFQLFNASDAGATDTALALNPNFAFWDHAYNDASQGEVFFTMATVMHTFRYSAEGRYALFSAPGHGYVLDPLNFGRFNDPVIQAAILRAATGRELDYRSHSEASQRMTDEILHLLRHREDARFGGASAEFALSIARGLVDPRSLGALRLHPDDLSRYGSELTTISPVDFPFLHSLGQFINARQRV